MELIHTSGDSAEVSAPLAPSSKSRSVLSKDIAEKIASVLDDPRLALELRKKGTARAARFTMSATASLIWAESEPWLEAT